MSRYPCLDELQTWLDSYLNFERTPQKDVLWLNTMELLCDTLGRPERAARVFHIAGSKGKGSVSAFISSILDAAGYRVGLYTSPHILDFAERVGSAHGTFTEDVYQVAASELMQTVNTGIADALPYGRRPTWFELVTLYAFLCFRAARTDYNVLEVGLGGRLDATNVVAPVACCITPIELEHTAFLGNTIAAIAAEKGGIIKPAVPVHVSAQLPAARSQLRHIAEEQHAPILFIDELMTSIKVDYKHYDYGNNCIQSQKNCLQNHSYSDRDNSFGMQVELRAPVFNRPLYARLRMLGTFQAENAMLAAIAVKSSLPSLPEDTIEQGLSATVLPGRFELLRPHAYAGLRALVLDGAHTVNSISAVLATFRAVFGFRHTAHLLFACAADKDMAGIARLFAGAHADNGAHIAFGRITLTTPGSATQRSNLASLCHAFDNAGLRYDCDENYSTASRTALEAADRESAVLLVTGSFYLLTEVKRLLAT